MKKIFLYTAVLIAGLASCAKEEAGTILPDAITSFTVDDVASRVAVNDRVISWKHGDEIEMREVVSGSVSSASSVFSYSSAGTAGSATFTLSSGNALEPGSQYVAIHTCNKSGLAGNGYTLPANQAWSAGNGQIGDNICLVAAEPVTAAENTTFSMGHTMSVIDFTAYADSGMSGQHILSKISIAGGNNNFGTVVTLAPGGGYTVSGYTGTMNLNITPVTITESKFKARMLVMWNPAVTDRQGDFTVTLTTDKDIFTYTFPAFPLVAGTVREYLCGITTPPEPIFTGVWSQPTINSTDAPASPANILALNTGSSEGLDKVSVSAISANTAWTGSGNWNNAYGGAVNSANTATNPATYLQFTLTILSEKASVTGVYFPFRFSLRGENAVYGLYVFKLKCTTST